MSDTNSSKQDPKPQDSSSTASSENNAGKPPSSERPSATPRDQRSNLVNFGEKGNDDGLAKF
jgi:hypothetical protein